MTTEIETEDAARCGGTRDTTGAEVPAVYEVNEESNAIDSATVKSQRNATSLELDIHDRPCCADMSNGRPRKKRRPSSTKSVRFSDILEQEMNCRPYCEEHCDAETLRLCHAKIWYEPIEYISFLKDRSDTIRIYKSLNGGKKMMDRYLGYHYSTRGLEHLLLLAKGTTSHPQQRRRQPRSQQLLTTKILLEQQRQGSDPETLREVAVAHSATALTVALRRASFTSNDDVVSIVEGAAAVVGYDGCHSSSDDDDGEDEGTAVPEVCTGKVSALLSKPSVTNPTSLAALLNPMPNINCSPRSPVDLPSLRRMNSQLVADMKARTTTDHASTSMLFTMTSSTTTSAGLMTAADRTREMLQTSLLSFGIFSPLSRHGTAAAAAAPHLACPSKSTSVTK